MPTVNDFIECNENCRIAIYWTPTIEDVGLFNDKLYDGMLYDVPEKFRDMKVVREGYGLTFKGNVLYVIGDRFGV